MKPTKPSPERKSITQCQKNGHRSGSDGALHLTRGKRRGSLRAAGLGGRTGCADKRPGPWGHCSEGNEGPCRKVDEASAHHAQGRCKLPVLPSTSFSKETTLKKNCDISKMESRKHQVLAVPRTLSPNRPQCPGENAGPVGGCSAWTYIEPGGIPSKGVRKSAACCTPTQAPPTTRMKFTLSCIPYHAAMTEKI